MEMRPFGRLGRVSALTLGGGGIGNVWGEVERAEAILTVRAALDAGVTMLDVAPTYGPGEAELVVGEALQGAVPDGVLITTKAELPDDEPGALVARVRRSLEESLDRLRIERVDLYLLHSQLRPAAHPETPKTLQVDLFRDVVRPEFTRLREEGLVRGWGLTGVGHPDALIDVLRDDEKPDAIQCIANAYDFTGDMWIWGDDVQPGNRRVREEAVRASVPVIGIRAVAAGSLADALDRPVEPDHPAARDHRDAASFRRLAAERGEPAAVLAHRYALSMPELATMVLGIKNRRELDEALAAEAAGRLSAEELRVIARSAKD